MGGYGCRWIEALPACCEVCGAWPHGPLCPACRRDLAALAPRCPGCALPHPDGRTFCPACRTQPPPWLEVRARLDYAYPWDGWITRLKTAAGIGLAAPLAQLWLDDPEVPALLQRVDGWLPVPSTPQRLAERGHHPVWTLMRALARRVPTPAALPQALVRSPTAPALHHLDRAGRLDWAERLLQVPAAAQRWVHGRHLLVVDDVMTTGTTLRAASLALLRAGAASVRALVLARTPPVEPPDR
ncbi:MAG: phosphoribosyltransferase family protein [Tepidimonas sp.]|uniref:ComF family protein n=1 Tax=Tepidimonas sp. TaxID=2002775 RepID=UPI00298F34A5|nr:phosphoribosyltransferase family protein [Tepidimonas sp.]MDW8337085.1 phosphoribosyltransferase family protein [Tepidimonas sp.]